MGEYIAYALCVIGYIATFYFVDNWGIKILLLIVLIPTTLLLPPIVGELFDDGIDYLKGVWKRTETLREKFSRFASAIGGILVVGIIVSSVIYFINYDRYKDYYVQEAYRNGTLQLQIIVTSKRTEYYHLGDDISITSTVNGENIGNKAIIDASGTLNLETVIKEMDSTPDVGKGKTTIQLPFVSSAYNASLLETKTITIRVNEAGGRRYPNAYAIYDVTYTVTPYIPKKDLNFFKVVFFIK